MILDFHIDKYFINYFKKASDIQSYKEYEIERVKQLRYEETQNNIKKARKTAKEVEMLQQQADMLENQLDDLTLLSVNYINKGQELLSSARLENE